jgi:hypothetical protein
VEGNPVSFADPSGYIKQGPEMDEANKIVNDLMTYNVIIAVDWKDTSWNYWFNDPIDSSRSGIRTACGHVEEGYWSINELRVIKKGVHDLARAMNGTNKFIKNYGYIDMIKEHMNENYRATGLAHRVNININKSDLDLWTIVHEMGHTWDGNNAWQLSYDLELYTHGFTDLISPDLVCDDKNSLPGCNQAGYFYGDVPAAGADENFNRREDFAESVAAYVYPDEARSRANGFKETSLHYTDYRTTLRWKFINGLINGDVIYQ